MTEQDDIMVRVAEVWKSYGEIAALVGVSCVVRSGTITCLLGQNGAGKSTLISLIVGLQRPDRGSVLVGGMNPFQWGIGARELVGFAPQELAVYAGLTVQQNLDFYCDVYRYRGKRRIGALDRVLDDLFMRTLVHRKVALLSGGEKRRLHTALALLAEAPLLVLDEPTVGADLASRERLLETVRKRADEGAAVIYSTHYLNEIERLGGHVIFLHKGQVKAAGRVDEMLALYGETTVSLSFRDHIPESLTTLDEGNGRSIRVSSRDAGGELLPIILNMIDPDDVRQIERVTLRPPNLDDVFVCLTRENTPTDTLGEVKAEHGWRRDEI